MWCCSWKGAAQSLRGDPGRRAILAGFSVSGSQVWSVCQTVRVIWWPAQILKSSNCWLIVLLFSILPWGINGITNWYKQIQAEVVFEILLCGLFVPAQGGPFLAVSFQVLSGKPALGSVAFYLSQSYQLTHNCFAPKTPLLFFPSFMSFSLPAISDFQPENSKEFWRECQILPFLLILNVSFLGSRFLSYYFCLYVPISCPLKNIRA